MTEQYRRPGSLSSDNLTLLQNDNLESSLPTMNLSLEKALALAKRDRLIARQARKMSLAEVGRRHGLTRERVRQIVKAHLQDTSDRA